MKKQIIYLAMFILVMKLSLANILLTFQPTHISIKNIEENFTIEISNNDSFDIFNLEFTTATYFTLPDKFNLTKNTSINKTVTILTDKAFSSQSFSTKFSFNTKTTGAKDKETAELHINLTDISDNNLQTFKDDTVRFYNNGTSNLTINDNNSVFIFTIEPNSFQDKIFTTIEEFSYVVQESGFIGKINIKDNIIDLFIHDPQLDQSLTFTLTSKNKPAQFTMTALLSDPVMEWNGSVERVILFESNETIFGMNLTADRWITFNENNFDFTGSKIVTYTIKPIINRTEDTNKVHNVQIFAKSENGGEVFFSNNIFIIPHNFSEIRVSDNKTIIFLPPTADVIDAYCKFRPKDCITSAVVIEYCKVNPQDCPKQEVLVNRTLTTEGQLLEDIKNTGDRTSNKVLTIQQEQLPNIIEKQNAIDSRISTLETRQITYEQGLEDEEKRATRGRVWGIIGWFALIIIGGGTLLVFYGRRLFENLSDTY